MQVQKIFIFKFPATIVMPVYVPLEGAQGFPTIQSHLSPLSLASSLTQSLGLSTLPKTLHPVPPHPHKRQQNCGWASGERNSGQTSSLARGQPLV